MLHQPSQTEIQQFITLFTQGKWAECELLAQSLVARFPTHGTCWKLLAVAIGQQGRVLESLAPMQQSVALQPEDAESHFNLGFTYQKLARLDEAKQSYLHALRLKPGYVDACNNLGLILHAQKRYDEAVHYFQAALAANPQYVESYNNLGLTLHSQEKFSAAEQAFNTAIALRPQYAEAYNNLGATLQHMGRIAEAERSIRRALELWPSCANAYNNLGNLLLEAGKSAEAEQSLRHALALDPHCAEAHNNLGNTLQGQKRLHEAAEHYQQALGINPQDEQAYNNLGTVLQEQGDLAGAEYCYAKALEINPSHHGAHSNLLFCINYIASKTATERLSLAQRYGAIVSAKVKHPCSQWLCTTSAKKLKVGIVSGDFLSHPVGYFLEGVLSNIHPEQIELVAYPTHLREDALTARLKPFFSAWNQLFGKTDAEAAQRIHADGIHILIDLAGHTAFNRLPLFAWKVAPVQVSWLGYFATTGVPTINYLLADPWTLPVSEECNFTERIWRLPETRLCFTPPDTSIDVSPLPAVCNGYVTFGCFNNLTKMNHAVVATWSAILNAIPTSKLLLKSSQLGDPLMQQKVVAMYAQHGISPDRLLLEGASPRAEYFAAYHRVDISLDPFPFTGGTTTAEGLWMGVPVLTLAGEQFVARQGVGLLMNAGLDTWIAASTEDYIRLAIRHASSIEDLSKLRAKLRQQVLQSPIFDAQRFAKHLEHALHEMWTLHCATHEE